MARIVLADDGIAFDGRSTGALGGGETAFLRLAENLAARGHDVGAFSNTTETAAINGVKWAPVSGPMPDDADLYIANRGDRVLDRVPGAKRIAFWLHNDARYLKKFRYLRRLWLRKPTLAFVSESHRRLAPSWLPGGERVVIPLGLEDVYRHEAERAPPPPNALYAANPLRGLAELATLWPKIGVADAKLIAHSGADLYAAKPRTRAAMEQALASVAGVSGIELRPLVKRDALIDVLRRARVFLYPGDPTETFCLSVAEAQALGVPCVVYARGALPERVIDGETGFVVKSETEFVDAARRLLTDDALWLAQHRACLATQNKRGWADMAEDFERLLP
ncbi:MAG: glycosyltransferase family 4 protein [Proteobacteria bacterium]|nr:glycosyltransferase family 4 protein [Pseudomonadota bacterium]